MTPRFTSLWFVFVVLTLTNTIAVAEDNPEIESRLIHSDSFSESITADLFESTALEIPAAEVKPSLALDATDVIDDLLSRRMWGGPICGMVWSPEETITLNKGPYSANWIGDHEEWALVPGGKKRYTQLHFQLR